MREIFSPENARRSAIEVPAFPKVKKSFAAAELDALGEQMEALFDEIKDTEPRNQVPAETGSAAPLE
jgi:hypothetical protein